MDKAPDAFRTITEVADLLGTPAHVLRFWESRFPQIRPVKRAGGRRYYRRADVELLAGIRKLLHDDGMTIRSVQRQLRELGIRQVASLGRDLLPDESSVFDPEASGAEVRRDLHDGSDVPAEQDMEAGTTQDVPTTLAPDPDATPDARPEPSPAPVPDTRDSPGQPRRPERSAAEIPADSDEAAPGQGDGGRRPDTPVADGAAPVMTQGEDVAAPLGRVEETGADGSADGPSARSGPQQPADAPTEPPTESAPATGQPERADPSGALADDAGDGTTTPPAGEPPEPQETARPDLTTTEVPEQALAPPSETFDRAPPPPSADAAEAGPGPDPATADEQASDPGHEAGFGPDRQAPAAVDYDGADAAAGPDAAPPPADTTPAPTPAAPAGKETAVDDQAGTRDELPAEAGSGGTDDRMHKPQDIAAAPPDAPSGLQDDPEATASAPDPETAEARLPDAESTPRALALRRRVAALRSISMKPKPARVYWNETRLQLKRLHQKLEKADRRDAVRAERRAQKAAEEKAPKS